MIFFGKNQENIEHFKLLYNDEIFHSMYKYVSTVSMDESDIMNYMDYFKKCEKLGLSYYFYFIDTYEDSRELVGFSDFAVPDMGESDLIDRTYLDSNDVNRFFYKIFKEEGYFIIGDNAIKKGSAEEIEYQKILERINTVKANRNKNPHLKLLK